MSLRAVRWTRRALRRLEQIGEYISKDNPQAASRVAARITSAGAALADYPEMGRTGRVKGTRELPLVDLPYIVAYRVKKSDVEILTIIHTAQKWPDDL
ncbi:type II toxin-antitoxin system RelE/ParE family toxin [Methylocystis sp. S23]|jgi:addiction module RelE/StbE family toxin